MFIFYLLSQVVEKSRAGFIRTEAFLEAYVDSFVEQTGNVHKALLWVLTQPEYEEFCVSCKTTKLYSGQSTCMNNHPHPLEKWQA